MSFSINSRDWNRANAMTLDAARTNLHHFYKYHDPDSPYYLGTTCVNCEFSDIQKQIEKETEEINNEFKGL